MNASKAQEINLACNCAQWNMHNLSGNNSVGVPSSSSLAIMLRQFRKRSGVPCVLNDKKFTWKARSSRLHEEAGITETNRIESRGTLHSVYCLQSRTVSRKSFFWPRHIWLEFSENQWCTRQIYEYSLLVHDRCVCAQALYFACACTFAAHSLHAMKCKIFWKYKMYFENTK